MNVNRTYHFSAIFLSFLFVITVFSGCSLYRNSLGQWVRAGGLKEIEGLSPEVLEELEAECGITIPSTATFLKGFRLSMLQRYEWVVLLECPGESLTGLDENALANAVAVLLKLDNKARYSRGTEPDRGERYIDEEIYEKTGGKMDRCFIDQDYDQTIIVSYFLNETTLLIRIIRVSD